MLGGINALIVGILEWPILVCENKFIEIASRIFPKPSPVLGSIYRYLYFAVRLLFKDALYPEVGPAIQSVVGDSLLCGPRGSLYEEHPAEQMKVAVVTTLPSTGKVCLLTSYDKTAHEKEACYSWLQKDETLSNIKIWQRYESMRCTDGWPTL
jgi:hypothetical protein